MKKEPPTLRLHGARAQQCAGRIKPARDRAACAREPADEPGICKKLGVPETAPAHRIQAARVVTHISGNALETTAAAFDGPPEKQVEALEFNSKGLSHTTHPAG
jgi:hypothetical protein